MQTFPEHPGSSDASYWRQRYQSHDTPWDKGRAHPALEKWLARNPEVACARVLLPGCGIGHDVRAWAAAGAHAVGLDLAPEATELARAWKNPSPDFPPSKIDPSPGPFFQGSATFITGSIFEPPLDSLGTFDWVCEHTCFCAFEPVHRRAYARSIAKLLHDGGKFFAIFYMRPDHDESPPYGSEEDELLELFGADLQLLDKWITEPTFPGREGREEIWIWERKTSAHRTPN